MTNLQTRAISGAIYVALIVCSLLFSPYLFGWLMVAFAVVSMIEYSNLVKDNAPTDFRLMITDTIGIFLVTVFPLTTQYSLYVGPEFPNIGSSIALFCLILAYFPVRIIIAMFTQSPQPFRRLAYSFFGVTYIGVGLLCASIIGLNFPMLALFLFIMIWVNDTGAYLVGCRIGKHKMTPRLSPKKSWEGLFGGMILSVIIGFILAFTLFDKMFPGEEFLARFKFFFALVIPVLVSIFATLGDLLESLLKRSTGVKDSGHIIPGHGGILDRIDSLLFVMPGIFLSIMLIGLV